MQSSPYKLVEKLEWRIERVSLKRAIKIHSSFSFSLLSGTCRGAFLDERSLSAVWQANWVPTIAPGNRWTREWIQCSHPASWPAVANERRLSCARRIGISKHPIVLSVSRSRVHHLFFPGHLSRRSSDSFGTTRSYEAAVSTTTSELQRPRPLRWWPESNSWYHDSGHRQVRRPNGDV